jgi:hypothetical protein
MNSYKTFPSGWKTKLNTPCPLLAPCSDCKQLLPVIDFYQASNGRKTILGTSTVSMCPKCANNRYKNLDPRIKLYYGARKRALSDGQKFTITVDDIVIPETCPVFGDKIEDGTGSGPIGGGFNDYSASLDRIDNSKGYEPGNIAVISRRANRTKNDSSVSDLVNLLVYSSKNGELLNESHLLVLSNLINNSKGKDFSND